MKEMHLDMSWPIGPDYSDWAGAHGVRGWVMSKLKSAAFHIDTLERIGQEHGYSRLVGVEMALDAALAALCGAFDASVGGIIHAGERYFTRGDHRVATPWKRIEPHNYNWERCRENVIPNLASEGFEYDIAGMVEEVNAALDTDESRFGWLTELQRLRNQTIHQNSLARHINVGLGKGHDRSDWELSVGARMVRGIAVAGRAEHPANYLTGAHERLSKLTARMVGLADHINPHDVPIEGPTQSVTVNPPAANGGASAAPPTLG